MTTHDWETSSKKDNINTMIPLRLDILNQLSNHDAAPKEGTKEYREIQEKQDFSHQTLLGEIMFTYVSCRPGIVYAITFMCPRMGQTHLHSITNASKA